MKKKFDLAALTKSKLTWAAVAEVLMDEGAGNVPFKRLAMPDVNATKVGCQAWMREQYGLGVNAVKNAVKTLLK